MAVTTNVDITKLSKTANGNGQGGYDSSIIDVQDFFDRVLVGYNEGSGEDDLPADMGTARSIIPAGTGAYRDFSYIAPEIPEFIQENCTGCMTCVTQCPDTAILGKAIFVGDLDNHLATIENDDERAYMADQFAITSKFYKVPERQKKTPGKFGIFIDPTKCKGCSECVEACDDLGYHA
ncbi:MAG: 4Fe-4S binding protein, partial [Caldilineaceae bacterium]